MRSWFILIAVLLCSSNTLANVSKSIPSPSDIPVEAFFKNNQFTTMSISPDGKHLAVIYSTGTSDSLAIMDVGLTEVKANINFGEFRRMGRVMWPRSDRFIVSYAKFVGNLDSNGEPPVYVAYDLDGTNGRQLTVPLRTSYSIISMLPNKPDKILVTKRHAFDEGAVKLFEIEIDKGKEDYIGGEPLKATSIIADNNGVPRVAVVFKDLEDEDSMGNVEIALKVKRTPNSAWELADLPTIFSGRDTRVSLLGFNAANTIAYISSDIKTTVPSVYSVNIATWETKLIHEENVAEISGRGVSYNDALEVLVFAPDYNRTVFLDEDSEMKKIMTQLYVSMGIDDLSSDISISSFTEDGNQLVFNVRSDRDPGVFYLFNRGLDGSEPNIKMLSVANDMLEPEMMAKMTPFQFKSRDGITLNGYKVLPITGEAPFPLVQIIHGGPHGPRDYWGWDREVQFLASRGYAVVSVNFRGSGGYGKAFERSGYEEWGGKMINDMTDATMYMVDNGYADKDRMCVYGGSYGGYGALQSVVREPDLYKCAIGYVGVYSLHELKKSGDIPKRESGRKFLDRVLGTDDDLLDKFSPAYNVDKIKADLFIAHGREDVRTPMEQYDVLSKNLKRIGKPYKSMLRDEGHGYQKDKNKYDYYKAMETFFAKHLQN
jgi:dipeptidyl aminopeptidase/acylaminoacyl peptidase